MKIIDGIKQKGTGIDIPGTSRNDLPEFFIQMGFKTGVEVGVYKAEFTEKFAQAGLNIFGIDPWRAYGHYPTNVFSSAGKRFKTLQDRQDFLYKHSQGVMAPYQNAALIRRTSIEALREFVDGSLDFVYVDGNHAFKYVVEDIWEWSKKIKKGGVISGHDYHIGTPPPTMDLDCGHVKYAVEGYTQAFSLTNWYLIGDQDKPKRASMGKNWRSWFWFKTW